MIWKKHDDVVFEVSAGEARTRVKHKWDEAVVEAFALSASRGGAEAVIDVLVHSEAGARAWLGEHGVEMYREDPEASVFQRFSVRAQDKGRIA